MKRSSLLLFGLLLGLLMLSACGDSDEATSESGRSEAERIGQDSKNQESTTNDGQQENQEKVRLSDDYADALSIQGQLALGILLLEDGDLAVDDAKAAELLPLWKALRTLSNSDTTAAIELEAVLNQIQEGMAAEQIEAIIDMKLTEDSLTSMIEEGELGFGRGAGRGDGGNGGLSLGGGLPGEGPGAGFAGGPGGGPSSGLGGGPGGGLGRGGASEEAIATRRAEFAAGGFGDIQEQLLVGFVERLLQQKSGETPETVGLFNTVFSLISEETGLSVEEIQELAAGGSTLAELVEVNDGDLDVVRAALIEAIKELPDAAELDAEQMADRWLGLADFTQ